VTRPDPTKCGRGLHDWTPENIYTDEKTGHQTCRSCKRERNRARDLGEAHPRNSGHCRKGHAYTPENTRKSVRFRNGVKEIHRSCKQCAKDSARTTQQ